MTVVINGEPRQLPEKLSVSALLEHLNLHTQACAVEVNKRLVPKPKHPEHPLAEGDKVEIVTLVGGG